MSDISRAKDEFEKAYETEAIELQVLMKSSSNGARKVDEILYPSVDFLAAIDKESGALENRRGRLEWIIEDIPGNRDWGYEFEKLGIYDVVVKRYRVNEKTEDANSRMGNRYMLVGCSPAKEPSDQLIKIKEHMLREVRIETDLGKLVLDREYSWFKGKIDWNGVKVSLILETDQEDGEQAETALVVANKLATSVAEWDSNMKKYAAQELVDLANDWLADNEDEHAPESIDEQYFIQAIKLSELAINSDGSITAYFDDGDLFWGHSIEVDIDEEGEFVSADIAG